MTTRRIFLSYRRSDSAGAAGRLADILALRFGESAVFMDVSDIPPGTDFTQFIGDAVASAAAMLVIIGPRWLDARSDDGRSRLENPNDFVRVEIEIALRRGLPIFPILVDGAALPESAQLPSPLRAVLNYQTVELRHSSFGIDAEVVVRGLSAVLGEGQTRSPTLREPDSQPASGTWHKFTRWLLRFFLGDKGPSGPSRSPPSQDGDELPRDDDVFQRLRSVILEARGINVPLAALIVCVERASCETFDERCTIEDLEEHLRAFTAGATLPIVNARLEVIFWERAVKSRRPRDFVDYLTRFPHGNYADRARSMRDQLIKDMGGFDPDVPKVFLNYRRVDSRDTADRIYATLGQVMPSQNIVMDVDQHSIIPALPVEAQLQDLVSSCDVMLALINDRSLHEINRRRAEHENGRQIDFVRAELKYGLARGTAMPVVPVLAEGVEHPRAGDLPDDISELSKRSSVRVSREHFSQDVLALLTRLGHFSKGRIRTRSGAGSS